MGILVLINKTVEIHFCAPWLGSPVRTEWGSLTFHILFMCMQCVCAIWKCLTQKKQQQHTCELNKSAFAHIVYPMRTGQPYAMEARDGSSPKC